MAHRHPHGADPDVDAAAAAAAADRAMRALVRETRLSPDMFMLPLFVCEGEGVRREVPSMPGVFNLSVDEAVRKRQAAKADGVRSVILFGLPDRKRRHRLAGLRPRGAGAGGDPRDQARGRRRARRHRRLPVRVHRPRPLRHRRSTTRSSTIRPSISWSRAARVARRGRRRHRRAVGHDGRPRRRASGRRSTSAASRTPRSWPTPRNAAPRSTARSATPPGRRRRSAIGGRTRWIRPTPTRRCARSSSDIAEGADIVMVKPAVTYLDVIARVKDGVRLPDRGVSRQRRVRDAEGGGAQRLDRRAARDARDADRDPPRRRRHHHHLLRARGRAGDRVTATPSKPARERHRADCLSGWCVRARFVRLSWWRRHSRPILHHHRAHRSSFQALRSGRSGTRCCGA